MGSVFLLLLTLGAGWLLLRNGDSDGRPPTIPPPEPLVHPGDRVWLLGDSMAVGLADNLRKLAKSEAVDLDVTAKVGAPTGWGRKRAEEVGSIYDLWLVCLGTNDLKGNREAALEHASAIKKLGDAKGANVIFLVPPDGGALEGHEGFFDQQKAAVSSFVLPPEDANFAPDRIHLTPQGYRQWAEWVWSSLHVLIEA